MLLKTILNDRYPLKRFVYGNATISGKRLLVDIRSRKNSKPRCGQCRIPGSTYDTRTPREFQFVPILGLQVFFIYAMRRVDCRQCGVKTEYLEWSSGKERMTTAYKWFLSTWARRMSWKEVSEAFRVSWDRVFEAVKHVVDWGLKRRDLEDIASIGVDEAF